ncbi:MAG: 1-acyl-sn-glycerol-3-phosphate acyltransferase [Streptosporangiaceae bacterium]
MLPPRLVRRLVFAPLIIAFTAVVLVTMPLLLLAGAIASHGRRRFLRVVWVASAWLALETAALSVCFAFWALGGFRGVGRADYVERHYELCGWFLDRIYQVASRALHLVVEIEQPADLPVGRPVIVLSRHAGPGDSFLVVHFLLNLYGRRPRIIMKSTLQLDPGIDVLVNRLPTAFVHGSAPGQVVSHIRRLAGGLGPDGALLIFPEGGNFTPHRRIRAIRGLRRRGRRDQAARAERMHHVLPPHVTGTLAAIEAAPGADVVFVAHTGLEAMLSAGDVWRAIPMEQSVRARWWRVPYEEIPELDRDRWLYDWWARIDGWIDGTSAGLSRP